ncbi:DUF2867 domain-containing protein [Desulfocurvus sp. DL9XJH121]
MPTSNHPPASDALNAVRETIPGLEQILREADHVDVKTFTGSCGLPTFLARLLSHDPAWIKALYAVRSALVPLLGISRSVPERTSLDPSAVPFAPGEKLRFLTVLCAEPERYWLGEAVENHLTAWFGVAAEPSGGGAVRFHVLTAVRYRRWTGALYFNCIRPFHHLVVASAGKRAAGRP